MLAINTQQILTGYMQVKLNGVLVKLSGATGGTQ